MGDLAQEMEIPRSLKGQHVRTVNIPGASASHTGTIEEKGAREHREDFTASSRELCLLYRDITEQGKQLPDWMKYGNINIQELYSVITDLEQDMKEGSAKHGYLRVLMDGMGGEANGEAGAVNGTMLLLFNYHRNIMRGMSQENSMASAIDQANNILYSKKIGKAVFAADLNGQNEHAIYWAGDAAARVFNANGQQIWENRAHSLVNELGLTPEQAATHQYRSVVTSGMGSDQQIKKMDTYRAGHLAAGQRIVLHSDGMILDAKTIGRILKESRTCQEAAERLKDMSIQAGSTDNVSVRVISDEMEDGAVQWQAPAQSQPTPRNSSGVQQRIYLADYEKRFGPKQPLPVVDKKTTPNPEREKQLVGQIQAGWLKGSMVAVDRRNEMSAKFDSLVRNPDGTAGVRIILMDQSWHPKDEKIIPLEEFLHLNQ